MHTSKPRRTLAKSVGYVVLTLAVAFAMVGVSDVTQKVAPAHADAPVDGATMSSNYSLAWGPHVHYSLMWQPHEVRVVSDQGAVSYGATGAVGIICLAAGAFSVIAYTGCVAMMTAIGIPWVLLTWNDAVRHEDCIELSWDAYPGVPFPLNIGLRKTGAAKWYPQWYQVNGQSELFDVWGRTNNQCHNDIDDAWSMWWSGYHCNDANYTPLDVNCGWWRQTA